MEFQLLHRLHTLLRSPPRRARQENEPAVGGSSQWHLLSTEILAQIFSYCETLNGKFTISLTCRDWFYVMWGTQNHLSLAHDADHAMKNISQWCPRLQNLWLSSVTDVGCEYLVQLEELRSLTLSRCHEITDAALENISRCSSLEECKISRCSVRNESLQHLQRLTNLKRLAWSGMRHLDSATVATLRTMKDLEEISIRGSHHITDEGLQELSVLPHLRVIDLSWCTRIPGRFLAHPFASLEEINLQWNYLVTDDTLKHMSQHSRLRKINISGCEQVTVAGIRALKDLTKIEELVLGDLLNMNGDSLHAITQSAFAPSLKRLHLRYGVGLSDDSFSGFGRLSSLQYLNLVACLQLRDEALQYIQEATGLQELDLSGNYFTPSGIRHLIHLPQLQIIEASDCPRLTDRSLESFASMPSLRSLNLSGCKRITPAALTYLKEQIFCGSCELEM